MKKLTVLLLAALGSAAAFGQPVKEKKINESKPKLETATFANGCFWCTEAIFVNVKGVESATSGYSGGKVKDPTYEQVSTGTTGYAESLNIVYDPSKITFSELLEVFWNTHDPTTLNQQGADHGPQYRSAVFYHTEEQKKQAEDYKKQLDASHVFKSPIVTEITAFTNFYTAEDVHKNYFALNPNAQYCQYVIRPKVEKFKKQFSSKLKK